MLIMNNEDQQTKATKEHNHFHHNCFNNFIGEGQAWNSSNKQKMLDNREVVSDN